MPTDRPKPRLPGRGSSAPRPGRARSRTNGRSRETESAPPRGRRSSPGRLDQFYTRREIAAGCLADLERVLPELRLPGDPVFIEPSAGAGAFFRQLPAERRIGLDIAPASSEIRAQDFLAWEGPPGGDRGRMVVVGNPPFGNRGRLALRFFGQAATFADTIAFIVPLNFRKFPIHRRLPPRYRWIFARPLPEDAFELPDGRDYQVRTEFQIWTRRPSPRRDRRLVRPEPIRHPDFVMWQYNNTREALKVFLQDFEFAVPCQGWQDYSRRETTPDACEKHKQWMLFRPRTSLARKRLLTGIDYGVLARRTATSVPGFRKGDLVREYTSRFGPGRSGGEVGPRPGRGGQMRSRMTAGADAR